ncbi:hypothetical protein GE061_005571 [Apolygus lucorum]|uniref:BTB domain-containing protein n=1 Tax=Apolygus lucorum TaxID=248454 RepID=A0A8S9WY13_APOLU|nr:hypothetical protein GE061_005571 [Apolygus lucorum]
MSNLTFATYWEGSDDSDSSISPVPDDPYYELSGPHVHNEITLECKWLFCNVFANPTYACTAPYTIEPTTDRISFLVKGGMKPVGKFYSLGIYTTGHTENHVLLFQFQVVTEYSAETYTTKRYIVHFTLEDSIWYNEKFLGADEVQVWLQMSSRIKIFFIMHFKYNVDHDFICHEPGHVKTYSCRLAKKRFKRCPPKRGKVYRDHLMIHYRDNLGLNPEMLGDKIILPADPGMVKLPPFGTLLKKQHSEESMENIQHWFPLPPDAKIQEPVPVTPSSTPYLKERTIFPTMPRLPRHMKENFQSFEENQEERLSNQVNQAWERAQEMRNLPSSSRQVRPENFQPRAPSSYPLPDVTYRQNTVIVQAKGMDMMTPPACSYQRRPENLQFEASTSYHWQNVPQPPSARRIPERPAQPSTCWGRTVASVPPVPVIRSIPRTAIPPAHASSKFISPAHGNRQTTRRRRTARKRIKLQCGGQTFEINSKILEDASPVMKAFMTYWTPNPNQDIILEVDGVTSIALENLLKYLSNEAFNHGVMRSEHMRELTRKLKIDLNLDLSTS